MAEINATSGSGLKLAIERTDLDNELRATASHCEWIEQEMMRQAVVLATGQQVEPRDAARELGYMLTREGSPQHRRISEQIDKASLASGRDVSRRRRRKGDA